MFTGLIEEIGKIQNIQKGLKSAVLSIHADKIMDDIHVGDSIAVNGVCLTATTVSLEGFTVDVMHETLKRTSLRGLQGGSPVNLERAMLANGRFGGHFVSGHIDGTGIVEDIRKDDNALWYTIRTSPPILRYIVEKGSITVDGISLTVAKVYKDRFTVSIIPHTSSATTLSVCRIGHTNLENDSIGKYVEQLIGKKSGDSSNITAGFLAEYGF